MSAAAVETTPAAAAPAAAAAASSSPAAPVIPAGHTQLYVKNLSFASTDETLGAFVESRLGSKPHSVHIVTRRTGGRSRGFGFITLPIALQQDAITKLDNVELEGRTLSVVEAKPRDPDAPANTNSAPRRPRQPRKPRADAPAAAASSSSSSSSSSQAAPAERKRPDRKTFPEATQLYVNNLAFAATADEVSALFEAKIGAKPLDVDIVRFQYGRFAGNSRGFGFVFVPNASLEKALSLDKSKMNDRELGIQLAKPPTDRPVNNNNNNNGAAAAAAPAGGDGNTDGPRAPRRRRPRRRPAGEGGENTSNGDNTNTTTGSDEQGNEAPDNRRRRGPGGPSTGAQQSGAGGEDGGRGRRRGGRGGRGRGRGGASADAAAAPSTA